MKQALREGSGPAPGAGVLRRLGDTLLRFAGEDRRLDQDALYELWSQADSRCWMDTEQEPHRTPLHGLPEGAMPVVADGPVVQEVERGANDSGFAPASGRDDAGMRAFQTEIDRWCRQRAQAQVPVQVRPRAPRSSPMR